MSASLLEEVTAQIKASNPNASPEEITESILSLLSKEILPAVLKNMSLPKFPTAREEIQEAKLIRGMCGSKANKTSIVSQRRVSFRMLKGLEL